MWSSYSGPEYRYFRHVNILSAVILCLSSPVIWNHWNCIRSQQGSPVSPSISFWFCLNDLLKAAIGRNHCALQAPRYTPIPKRTENQRQNEMIYITLLHYHSSPFPSLPWGVGRLRASPGPCPVRILLIRRSETAPSISHRNSDKGF